jgi:hypothetical protein
MYYYLAGGYVVITVLAFIFSGLLGGPPDETAENAALGSVFWPVLLVCGLFDQVNVLRVYIASKALERANRPRPKKIMLKSDRPRIAQDDQDNVESCYREMDCKTCGHTLALRKNA